MPVCHPRTFSDHPGRDEFAVVVSSRGHRNYAFDTQRNCAGARILGHHAERRMTVTRLLAVSTRTPIPPRRRWWWAMTTRNVGGADIVRGVTRLYRFVNTDSAAPLDPRKLDVSAGSAACDYTTVATGRRRGRRGACNESTESISTAVQSTALFFRHATISPAESSHRRFRSTSHYTASEPIVFCNDRRITSPSRHVRDTR